MQVSLDAVRRQVKLAQRDAVDHRHNGNRFKDGKRFWHHLSPNEIYMLAIRRHKAELLKRLEKMESQDCNKN